MRLHLLGPLEGWENGRELSLGAGRQRALLALLALHRGEVVAADRLIEELWSGQAPASAAKVVQGYISQLRRSLPPDTIVTRGSGYVLTGVETDAAEFERLVETARDESPTEAVATLTNALALWRGRPLVDVEYEAWAQAEIARLEELRLAALEERIDAELQLGRAGELVPQLEALVREHPLRERMRGQLMLALYRSGRQAEALSAYAEGRRLLVDELGIEPGPALQELQRRILAHDAELGPVTGPPPLVAVARRARWLVVAGLVILAGAVAAALALTRGSSEAIAGAGLAVLDPGSAKVRGQIPLTSPATALAVGSGSLWALSGDTGAINEVDLRTRRLVATFAAGPRAVDIAYGGGSLWVLTSGARTDPVTPPTVSRIDPRSRAVVDTIRLPAGDGPEASPFYYGHLPNARLLAWTRGRLWALDPNGALHWIDPAGERLGGTISNLRGAAIAARNSSVWVRLDRPGPASFVHVDVRTGAVGAEVRTPAVAQGAPSSFAFGNGALWIPDAFTGTLWRVTPGATPVVRAVPIGIGVTSVVFAGGHAWAGDGTHDTVSQVDGATGRIQRVVPVPSPQSLVAGSFGIWVGAGPEAASSLPRSSCGPVVYGGPGKPQFLIASDLALQGYASRVNLEMARAVQWELRAHGYRAGSYRVGYQSCDDSSPQAGTFDFAKCVANAQLYAKTQRVLGVVGTYNSECAADELPILNAAPLGAVPIVSPTNTYQLLTRLAPGQPPGVLKLLYPTGVRNFMRVTTMDTHQIAATAELARRLGLRRVLIVADDGTGGSPIHTPQFQYSAGRLGLRTRVFLWRIERQPATAAVSAARGFRADGVFIAAGFPPRTGQLIRALRTAFGRRFPIIATDYLQAGRGIWDTGGGAIGEGVYTSTLGVFNGSLPPAGRRFLRAFGAGTPSFGAAYAAQAADVLLQAIARSNGTRTSVIRELHRTDVRAGILGRIRFDRYGDLVTGPVTILRLHRGPGPSEDAAFVNTVVDSIITPPPRIVP